jgi:sugar phosphate isomerase/epimerase
MSWRIGFSTGACTNLPILNILPAIRATGVSGVEVGTPPNHFDPRDKHQVEALKKALQAADLEAVSIHAPFGGPFDLADPDPHHRNTAVDASLTASAAISQLGGRLVVVHPSDRPRHDQNVQAGLADAARSLMSLAASCASAGLSLVVESPLPHLIGGSPAEFSALLRDLPPTVGVCLDTGHLALGRHWDAFIDIAGPRLRHIHANDNHGTWDDHLPPGDGQIDWSHIATSLRAARFSGWIMLELACPGTTPMSEYLSRAHTKALALMG